MTSPASDSLQEIADRLDSRIRTVDEARWLSSRYATEQDRVSLIVLYAFYFELARVRVAVSDQTLGNIRFQWWRDALGELDRGEIRQHDVVLALADQFARARLHAADLMPLIDAHETAFLANDRALEPEGMLVRAAAAIAGSSDLVDDALETIAAEWAGLRRGEASDRLQPRLRVASSLRPVTAHFRLRRLWVRDRDPGAMRIRGSILMAMLTGRV